MRDSGALQPLSLQFQCIGHRMRPGDSGSIRYEWNPDRAKLHILAGDRIIQLFHLENRVDEIEPRDVGALQIGLAEIGV